MRRRGCGPVSHDPFSGPCDIGLLGDPRGGPGTVWHLNLDPPGVRTHHPYWMSSGGRSWRHDSCGYAAVAKLPTTGPSSTELPALNFGARIGQPYQLHSHSDRRPADLMEGLHGRTAHPAWLAMIGHLGHCQRNISSLLGEVSSLDPGYAHNRPRFHLRRRQTNPPRWAAGTGRDDTHPAGCRLGDQDPASLRELVGMAKGI